MKILFITTIPSPYRVDFFNELGKRCELTVLFEKNKSDERNASWENYKFDNFNGIILKGVKTSKNKAFCPFIIKFLKQSWDFIVCCNMSTLTGIFEMFYMHLKKIPYIIEADGALLDIKKRGLKEKIKKMLISNSFKCFSSSRTTDEYFEYYGANRENIIRYPFTSVKEENIIKNEISNSMKMELKKQYNVKEEKIVLGIGRLIKMKGFEYLIKAFNMIQPNNNVGLYIIGGNQRNLYENLISEENKNNIHFIDFLPKEKVYDYCKLSDIFVLPTLSDAWGLVINEALANGLPVITTNKCVAGLEMVKDDFNGYIVPIKNYDEIYKKINCILDNDTKRKKMSVNSIKVANDYTIEKMVEKHIETFNNLRRDENETIKNNKEM